MMQQAGLKPSNFVLTALYLFNNTFLRIFLDSLPLKQLVFKQVVFK
jgi:hypothetical protein